MRSFNPFDKGPLCDPVSKSLGMGAVGLVGNVAGGIFGSSAAKKAGEIQNAAAQAAAADIKSTNSAGNADISNAASSAAGMVTGASGEAADRVSVAGDKAGQGAIAAAGDANALLNPYTQAGSTAADVLNKGIAAGGDFNRAPTMADIQIDPGYAFRLQQGQTALERSGAARGGALGGGAAKELAGYSQGLASQEYQNAFNRFQTSTQNRFNNVSDVSKQGLGAAVTQGGNLMDANKYAGTIGLQAQQQAGTFRVGGAQYAGDAGMHSADLTASNSNTAASRAADYTTGGAAAKAAGIVGGANALTGGISQGINSATSAVNMANYLQNPALQPVGGYPSGVPAGIPGGVPPMAGGR